MSAAFSAIMMTVALVLPDTTVGITEASTTRSPGALAPSARHPPPPRTRAHHAGAGLMERRARRGADVLQQILVGLRLRPRKISSVRTAASPRWRKSAASPAAPPRLSAIGSVTGNSAASPAVLPDRAMDAQPSPAFRAARIAISEQPGNRCIGSPIFGALPARNWYCTSGLSSSGRVFTNRPIGPAPVISGPLRRGSTRPRRAGATSCGRSRSSSPCRRRNG